MPHLLVERMRSCSVVSNLRFPKLKESCPLGAYFVEVLDVCAAAIFVAGSVCFLPAYAANVRTFFLGCSLFITGSVQYCIVCGLAFGEALVLKGVATLEVLENGLYLVGSLLYLAGSVLYLPPEEQLSFMHRAAALSLGQICETTGFVPDQLLGTVLFIAGSLLFVLAAFTNMLLQKRSSEWSARVLSAATSFYMGGSLLFAVGSIAFLPSLGCSEHMLSLGAWCFIVGSCLFLLGSLLSLWRTIGVAGGKGSERDPLVG